MKSCFKLSLLTLALVLALSPRAQAHDHRQPPPPRCDHPGVAPEVDPSLAFGGLTLLGGTLTVLRAKRRN